MTEQEQWRASPAVVLIALAGLLVAPTVMRFRKADTPFSDFRKPATTLIMDGPYRYSRNPAYLALTLLYLGVGVLFSDERQLKITPDLCDTSLK